MRAAYLRRLRRAAASAGAAAWLAAVAGCGGAQVAPNAAVETPARIVHPTPESREAVSHAVERALLLTHVTIDPDALTTESALVVAPGAIRDPRRLELDGRDPSDPGREQRFRLVKIGERCMLVFERTNQHFDLMGTECAPL